MAAQAPPSKPLWGLGDWFQGGGAAAEEASGEYVTKVGAGLLLRDAASGACLLLLRRSVHNDNTWGLPGGNVDPGDGALLRGARAMQRPPTADAALRRARRGPARHCDARGGGGDGRAAAAARRRGVPDEARQGARPHAARLALTVRARLTRRARHAAPSAR